MTDANRTLKPYQVDERRFRFILKTAVEYIPANKNQHKLDRENWVM